MMGYVWREGHLIHVDHPAAEGPPRERGVAAAGVERAVPHGPLGGRIVVVVREVVPCDGPVRPLTDVQPSLEATCHDVGERDT